MIVAHPDDETLWAGGTLLSHPAWRCFIVSLCRGSDPDRAPRFYQALKVLNSEGILGDLDDGPAQEPLDDREVEQAILSLLPSRHFDLILSHNPSGEYTRHLRHEEAGKAVIRLWHAGTLSADELWIFAYEDGGRKYYPAPVKNATIYREIPESIWQIKYRLITQTYGFGPGSFEAETTPRAEAFWRFTNARDAMEWLQRGGIFP